MKKISLALAVVFCIYGAMAQTSKSFELRYFSSTPNANAISVAIGMPHPIEAGVPRVKNKNILAGTIMPPKAAAIGTNACLGDDSSPIRISRFISKPTKKKNKAINPSLIHNRMGFERMKAPRPTVNFICQSAK